MLRFILTGIALSIVVLSSGCGGHTTDNSAAAVSGVPTGPAVLTPDQQTQHSTYAQQQSAMMQAQMRAHPPGSK